jgi:hypothetical protein
MLYKPLEMLTLFLWKILQFLSKLRSVNTEKYFQYLDFLIFSLYFKMISFIIIPNVTL